MNRSLQLSGTNKVVQGISMVGNEMDGVKCDSEEMEATCEAVYPGGPSDVEDRKHAVDFFSWHDSIRYDEPASQFHEISDQAGTTSGAETSGPLPLSPVK